MKPDTPDLPTESEKDQPRGMASLVSDANPPSYFAGIGASAGGLEALEAFFKNMHPHSGLAFVIVQHLSPNYKRMMVELLYKRSDTILSDQDGLTRIFALLRERHKIDFTYYKPSFSRSRHVMCAKTEIRCRST